MEWRPALTRAKWRSLATAKCNVNIYGICREVNSFQYLTLLADTERRSQTLENKCPRKLFRISPREQATNDFVRNTWGDILQGVRWWPEEELSGSGRFPLCRTCLLSPKSWVAGFANCLVCPCAPQPSQWPVPVNERMVVPNHFTNNGDYRIPPFVIKDNKRLISWVVTSLNERASVSLFWTTRESCHKRRGNIPLAVLQTGDIWR